MITSETKISAKIDWLSTTVDDVVYPSWWTKLRKELPHGMLKYDTAIQYLDGRLELCHSSRDEMKPHVQFSGSCIDRIAHEGRVDTVDILTAMSYGKPSRIDIAIDVQNGSLDIFDLSEQFASDKAVTRAKAGLYLSGVKIPGATFYVGSRGSSKRLRIYDKAAEQGIDNLDWTRIELQLRHGSAHGTQTTLMASSDKHLAIAQLINGFCCFPEVVEWCVVMGQESLKPARIDMLPTNRRKWLLDTASKALANEIVESIDGEDFMQEFLQSVRHEVLIKRRNYK